VFSRLQVGAVLCWMVFLSALGFVTLASAIDAGWANAAMALLGFSAMAWNVTTNTVRQVLAPGHLLGRLVAAWRVVTWGAAPLGAATAGVIADASSLRLALGWCAAIATSALGLLWISLKRSSEDGPLVLSTTP
jgi:hypothetical protein